MATDVVSILLSLTFRTEHIDNLVLVELLHLVAGRTEILAGVKLCGLLVEDLAHGSCHGQTAVGVDIDLADIHLCSLAEFLFGDTDCIGQFTAVGIDDVDIFLRYGR